MRRLQELHSRLLARALRDYFHALADRVARRYLSLAKAVNSGDLLLPEDHAELQALMERYLGNVIEEQSALNALIVGGDPLAPGMPGYQLLQREVASRVVDITQATMRSIQDTLAEGLRNGYTARQIANGVPADEFRGLRSIVAETYANRHETIARTEVGFIANRTTNDRYRNAGVREVDIEDGPDCGWTEHDDPDLADGSRRTMDEFEAYPLSHPNCVRVPLPVVEF